MRRLARHLFTLCAAMSLMLFVYVAGMRPLRPYFPDRYARERPAGEVAFTCGIRARELHFRVIRYVKPLYVPIIIYPNPPTPSVVTTTTTSPPTVSPASTRSRYFGGLVSVERNYPLRPNMSGLGPNTFGFVDSYSVPVSAVVLAAAILPITWIGAAVMRWRRRHRCDPCSRLCTTCGYDLRASPDRCPECGTPAN